MSQGLYSAGFVLNIIVNGKMQTVAKDNTIAIPFNSEYQLRIQNKNSRRAVAKVFIDDENVSEGGVVIQPYGFVDLEGPVGKNFNFKFVSLDSGQAADAGKSVNRDGEKGTIRVEFQLEREQPPVYIPVSPLPWNQRPRRPWRKDLEQTWNERGDYPASYSMGDSGGATKGSTCSYDEGETEVKTCGGILTPRGGSQSKSLATNDGCTVSGERNNQSFYLVDIELENKPSVILQLKLLGWDKNTLPILDGSCVYCSSCGKKTNKASDKFCSRCGSRLS